MDIPGDNGKDTPKEKKHREQMIVLGTIVLVVLTFMMVKRSGSNAGPVGAGGVNGFTPDTSGGSGGPGDMSYLPAMLGALPGQVAALEQGNSQQEQAQLSGIQSALANLHPQTIVQTVTGRAPAKKHKKHKPAPHKAALHPHHPSRMHHPARPVHPIVVSHHTAAKHTTGRKSGHHPAQHHATVPRNAY